MRSARAYALVAVVLAMGALLGAVTLAWGDPGATRSNAISSALNPEPGPVGGGGAKQTPLLMKVLDAPQPVKGSDGKYHLVYELVLTNSSPGAATVDSVETIDSRSGEVVGTLAGADIVARTTLLGEVTSAPAEEIGTGRVAILFLDVAFDDRRDVPREIEHRVRTSFDLPSGALFPERTTDTGARAGVFNKKPVVIGPPMRGKNWVVSNGCCTVSIHRGAVLAMDQKLLAAERYAIDWIRSDDEGYILLPSDTTNTKLTDYPAYGEPILSVKGGKVVKVVDKYPDLKPGVRDPDYKLKDAPGNHVIVDIGGGRYAIYAHLLPGSITVEEGEQVGRGQVLGRLGNSGNTNAPHLHFHVMDGPTPLGADHNLPYVFDSFRYQGYIGDDLTPHLLKNPQPREDELPLNQSVVAFRASR
jgi:Peptidase family M23